MYDNIAFYSDNEVREWYQRFMDAPEDVLIISDIPFGFYEVRNELLRRDRIKEPLED